MCNAWNHPADCNCGWGGDTGGGFRGFTPFGRDWEPAFRPSIHTYLNPNARCPKCQKPVYFYRSPFNGRVYFDDIGWPWPKHPCMESVREKTDPPRYNNPSGRFPSRVPFVFQWQPLIVKESKLIAARYVIGVDEPGLPGRYIVLPRNFLPGAPIFWRRSRRGIEFVELSSLSAGYHDDIHPIEDEAIGILQTDSLESVRRNNTSNMSDKECNAIGWAISFDFRHVGLDWKNHSGVDLKKASMFFEKASENGYWPAIHNLGIMFRDGLGVQRDMTKAFSLLSEASKNLHPQTLMHLSDMVSNGHGCVADKSLSQQLRELAKRQPVGAAKRLA